MSKSIKTIPEDIVQLFEHGHGVSEENMSIFLDNLRVLITERLSKSKERHPSRLSMSKIGTPNRKLYFDLNTPEGEPDYSNSLKFLYGDIIEQLILLLVKEAGHEVTHEQAEVEVDGVKGHLDCKIDGVVVDVKSASSFAFKKFAQAELLNDDPFGYIHQISAYSYPDNAAFLAVNKENGAITVLEIDKIDLVDPKVRIAEIKEILKQQQPPEEKCYPEVVQKNGNKTLHKNCTYCQHKFKCWNNLRVFDYAGGPVYFTEVVSEPRVEEITQQCT